MKFHFLHTLKTQTIFIRVCRLNQITYSEQLNKFSLFQLVNDLQPLIYRFSHYHN